MTGVRTVVITGGAGFIGYHLARYHAELGDSVVLLDNLFKQDGAADEALEQFRSEPRVRCEIVDLTRPIPRLDGLEEPAIVYHLAAINGTRLFYEIPYVVARTNVGTTLRLLEWLEGRRVGRLVFASTSEVYAGCEPLGLLQVPTAEDVPVAFPQPTDVRFSYGTSKFMGEILCLLFGRERGVPVTVVRYHNIYGPRMGTRHVIPELIARLRRSENPLRLQGAGETRAFCFVRDAVEATYLLASSQDAVGEVVHVGCSREEIAIRDLARLTAEAVGIPCDLEEVPGRSGSVSRRCPDTAKLKRLTGFEAKIDLREGLRQTVAWYAAHPAA